MAQGVRHEPTEETRALVRERSGLGQSQEAIGRKLGIDDKTLRKHYAAELEKGIDEANTEVASAIYLAATGRQVEDDGTIKRVPVNTALAIWWSKTRMNPVWREPPREIDETAPVPELRINVVGGLASMHEPPKPNGHGTAGSVE